MDIETTEPTCTPLNWKTTPWSIHLTNFTTKVESPSLYVFKVQCNGNVLALLVRAATHGRSLSRKSRYRGPVVDYVLRMLVRQNILRTHRDLRDAGTGQRSLSVMYLAMKLADAGRTNAARS